MHWVLDKGYFSRSAADHCKSFRYTGKEVAMFLDNLDTRWVIFPLIFQTFCGLIRSFLLVPFSRCVIHYWLVCCLLSIRRSADDSSILNLVSCIKSEEWEREWRRKERKYNRNSGVDCVNEWRNIASWWWRTWSAGRRSSLSRRGRENGTKRWKSLCVKCVPLWRMSKESWGV